MVSRCCATVSRSGSCYRGIFRGRPPTRPRALAGREADRCAFAEEVALEFCDCAEYLEDQLSARRRGVDRLGKRLEADALAVEVVDCLQQMGQRTAESVEPPHNETVGLATSSDAWSVAGRTVRR